MSVRTKRTSKSTAYNRYKSNYNSAYRTGYKNGYNDGKYIGSTFGEPMAAATGYYRGIKDKKKYDNIGKKVNSFYNK